MGFLVGGALAGCGNEPIELVSRQSSCGGGQEAEAILRASPDVEERIARAAGGEAKILATNSFDDAGTTVLLVVATSASGVFGVVGFDPEGDGEFIAEQNLQGLAPPLHRSDSGNSVFGAHLFTPHPARFIATTEDAAESALIRAGEDRVIEVELCDGIALQRAFVMSTWPNDDVVIEIRGRGGEVLDEVYVEDFGPVD